MNHKSKGTGGISSLKFWTSLALLAALALLFYWEEHSAHILAALPWILILACRSCTCSCTGDTDTPRRVRPIRAMSTTGTAGRPIKGGKS